MVLAGLPLGLLFLGFLLSWAWGSRDWPLLMHLPPPYWVIAGALVTGAVVGVSKRVPVWSFSWLAMGLYALGTIGEVAVFVVQSTRGVIEPALEAAFARSSGVVSLIWVFLALAIVIYVARRNRRDALFFFALFVAAKVVGFPILTGGEGPMSAPVVTGLLAALAGAGGVALILLLGGVVRGQVTSWRPVWGTAGLALLNAPVKVWPLLLETGPMQEKLRRLGSVAASEWLQEGLLLAAALVVSWIYLALREKAA